MDLEVSDQSVMYKPCVILCRDKMALLREGDLCVPTIEFISSNPYQVTHCWHIKIVSQGCNI